LSHWITPSSVLPFLYKARREVSVRAALGASRWRLARMLLTESLILSLTGGLLGALVAHTAVDALRSIIPAEVPRAADVSVDGRVLLATAIAAIGTGLMFGVTPLIHFWKRSTAVALNQRERAGTAGTATQKLRATLVVAEVALAIVLIIGAIVQLRGMRTVVGVVGDIRHDGPESQIRPQAYVPFAQSRLIGATVVLQSSVDARTLLPAVKVPCRR
jgi:putative ABC transport system permease protein